MDSSDIPCGDPPGTVGFDAIYPLHLSDCVGESHQQQVRAGRSMYTNVMVFRIQCQDFLRAAVWQTSCQLGIEIGT
jgi:hypothetical protein